MGDLRHELEKRRQDLLALEKQTQEKLKEMVQQGSNPSDDEEFLGLFGMQQRHVERIREIEDTKEIFYQSWSGVRVELAAGVLCEVAGLAKAVMV